jgi:hypothetical protein
MVDIEGLPSQWKMAGLEAFKSLIYHDIIDLDKIPARCGGLHL